MEDKEEYEEITDNSTTGFEHTTDKGLVQTIEWHNPLTKDYLGDPKTLERAKLEMTRRLRVSIERFNKQSSKQTNWIIGLTIAMVVVGIAQIGLLIYSILKQI